MNKWAKVVGLLVVLLALGLAAGCGGGGQEEAKDTGDTIKIGVNYELSGEVATFGSHTKDGIMLAFEEINANGGVLGKKIEPIVRDNRGIADEAMSVATKLITEEGIVAHLGAATTGCTLAAVPVCMQYKIPLLTTSATNPDVTVDPKTGETREYIFRTCFIDPPQAIVGADFAYNDLKARKVAIYYDNTNDYSKGLAVEFEKAFEAIGGQVVATEGYGKDDEDFRPTLTNFSKAGADLIYVPGYYQKVAKIISQARELGIKLPFLGADGWDSPELVSIAGAENLNNTYFTNHYSSSDPSERVQNFVKAYKKKYGSVPDSFAALGYDAAYLIVDAIKRAGSAEPEAIKEALAQTKNFEAVTGTLSFDEKHNPVKEIAIIEMVDGKQVLKTKKAPKS
ncbi:MAG TPA: ethanolamine utilization protein EutJ [Peptococcaceae bacterium]|nr:MAG: Amino acid/amide ABC transporter substrate-binding protein, HAAT family [Clostridia bacterium 41_269]HBT20244.1 ethanolamine utilization protein EutJ [Peptococcaceae bacterium]